MPKEKWGRLRYSCVNLGNNVSHCGSPKWQDPGRVAGCKNQWTHYTRGSDSLKVKTASKRFKQSRGWQTSNELLKEHGMFEVTSLVSEVGNKINHCLPDPAPLVTGCPAEDPGWEGLTLTQGFTTSLSNLCGFTSAQPLTPWQDRHRQRPLGSLYGVCLPGQQGQIENFHRQEKWKWKSLSRVQLLWPPGLYSPWNSPDQNTEVGSLSLLQGIYPTQGSNPGLLHCRLILYQLSNKGSPRILKWVAYPLSSVSFWPRIKPGSPALQVDSRNQ